MKSRAKDCNPRTEFQSRTSAARQVDSKSARFGFVVHIGLVSINLGAQVDLSKLSWSSVAGAT